MSNDVHQEVTDLVRKHKITDPFELAQRMNINVWFLDLPDGVRGYYYRVLNRRYIAINKNYPYEIQCFVCAHELGHDRLHPGMGYYFIEDNTLFNPGKFERQANRFAVLLLTYNADAIEGETIEQFYARHSIPKEIIGKI
ncbi:ImmA/IrrE family metallo-endopeptidase [Aneurinibacillus aneurinilyticus]|uniref:ImmA/IrrE family metallo-endopeptidase n=1 Tax=Aneurinibacillus aneurinilyticus TaxID=1391 RepID=UPI003671C723